MLPVSVSKKICIWRGVQQRCPKCGRGQLFKTYLKPVAHCAACGEPLGHIRADDFPPWMTVILVGHLLIPFVLAANLLDLSTTVQLAFWVPIALALTLLLLPRCKGAAIGLMWSLDLAPRPELSKRPH